MPKSKKKGIPAPSARTGSALLRMDRARGLRAGTSARQSRKLGSYNTLLFQHQLAQLQANAESMAKRKGSK
jgi:hypothetical protein